MKASQLGAIEVIAVARYHSGEIDRKQLGRMFLDPANWPDPEVPLTETEQLLNYA